MNLTLQENKFTSTRHKLEFEHIAMIVNKQITKYPLWMRFIKRMNKREIILKLKESWSLFWIVDIYFNQRMIVNLIKEQNLKVHDLYKWKQFNSSEHDEK